jgi:nucleoside phosphorylase
MLPAGVTLILFLRRGSSAPISPRTDHGAQPMATSPSSRETPADEPDVQPHEVTVGILTALPVELRAMADLVEGVRQYRVQDDPNSYRLGRIPSSEPDQPHRVAMLAAARDGTQHAATCCAHLLRTFPNIKTVVMTGIAGGIPRPERPAKHVRLGDIVVAVDGIVTYGNVRQEDGTSRLRGRQSAGLVSPRLLAATRDLQFEAEGGERRWERLLDPEHTAAAAAFPRPDQATDRLLFRGRDVPHPPLPESVVPANMPRVHYGAVGSSDMLMVDEDFRDQLARDFPDMFAIEMEAAGIAASTSVISRDWFMVRGVADYSDSAGKSDTWHQYASYTAAAYVRAVLETAPPIELGVHPQTVSSRALLGPDDQATLDDILLHVPTGLDIEPAWKETMRLDVTPAAGPPSAETPSHPAQAFHYLAGRNAGASGLHPAIVFLGRLVPLIRRRDDGLADRLDAWISRYTDKTGGADVLRARLRSGSGDGPAAPVAGPALVVELAVLGPNRDRFWVASYIQESTGPWRPRLLSEEEVTEDKIQEAVDESVAGAERTWATLRTTDQAEIEFVLPCGLINLPVQWFQTRRMGVARPICVRYPVAVRSQERMREQSVRREWANRWDRLDHQPFAGQIRWGVRYQNRPTTVEAWSTGLMGNGSYVVVVLSEPPETELGLRELFAALEAGVPVILWDQRAARMPAGGADELRRLTAQPAALPAHTRALRVAAAERPEEEPDHYGRSVALLWDNPNRVLGGGGVGS